MYKCVLRDLSIVVVLLLHYYFNFGVCWVKGPITSVICIRREMCAGTYHESTLPFPIDLDGILPLSVSLGLGVL
jgi:hypothetical protein